MLNTGGLSTLWYIHLMEYNAVTKNDISDDIITWIFL